MQFADIDDMDTVRTALVDVSAHVLVELLRANVCANAYVSISHLFH